MSGTKRKIFGAEFKAKLGLEAIHGVKDGKPQGIKPLFANIRIVPPCKTYE